MSHDRNEYEPQEDTEYHFSEDQINYDVETEVVKIPTETTGEKKGFAQYRKPMIGGIFFLILLFFIYKILAPASTAPATEFGQAASTKPIAPPSIDATLAAGPSAATPPAKPVISAPEPTPLPKTVAAPPKPAPSAPSNEPTIIMSGGDTPVPPPAPPPPIVETKPIPPAPPPVVEVAVKPALPTAVMTNPALTQTKTRVDDLLDDEPAAGNAQLDKLMSLQMQNSKVLNQLQVQTTQRLAKAEEQTNMLQSKLQDLSSKVADLETNMSKLGQVLVQSPKPRAEIAEPSRPTAVIQTEVKHRVRSVPKLSYTVQAIIPGRAWLKSDTGDTVTVAEGDTLRGFRVMKIDPYDGIVELEMNGKIVSLSYGS